MVTASGETPIFRSQRASGVNSAVKKPRACLFSIRLPRPGLSHLLPDLIKGLGDGLGLGDDGEEIAVPSPPRNDVLVQVRRDSGSPYNPLVHAKVEAAGIGHLAQDPHGRLGQVSELRRFFN